MYLCVCVCPSDVTFVGPCLSSFSLSWLWRLRVVSLLVCLCLSVCSVVTTQQAVDLFRQAAALGYYTPQMLKLICAFRLAAFVCCSYFSLLVVTCCLLHASVSRHACSTRVFPPFLHVFEFICVGLCVCLCVGRVLLDANQFDAALPFAKRALAECPVDYDTYYMYEYRSFL